MISMSNITKNFSYEEFLESNTAKVRGIDNSFPNQTVKNAVKELAERLLQPLRDAYGKGIRITSGYRCPALNKAAGGAATSAHLTGYAADLQPVDGDIAGFTKFVVEWLKRTDTAFDQCITERNTRTGARWLHIGLKGSGGKQRRQFLNITIS